MYEKTGQHVRTIRYALNKDYHNISRFGDQIIYCLDEGYAFGKKIIPKATEAYKIPIELDKIIFKQTGNCFGLTNIKSIEIPHADNSFVIYFHQPTFDNNNIFTYSLDKNADKWQEVKDPSFIEISNLKSGQYTLMIKSNKGDTTLIPLRFTVLKPWYNSLKALIFYFLAAICSILFAKRYFNKKLYEEKVKLEMENQRLLREHKIEIENDRLIEDNLSKSKELANTTMHLIQKNELLNEIKNELIDVRKTGDHTLTTKDFQNLMKIINENMTIKEDKNLFESNFNQVHDVFLKKIKAAFPELTAADMRLAAYLKMNLSSKEIAPLFNISLRGLENKRYRLRKKLGLPFDANLTEFFLTYG
ncbi:MAG: hypothetical protein IPO92_13665 [Saprospiraceae bacterium]|nr:hypothetical protein [Saprospiraceae bacterium]